MGILEGLNRCLTWGAELWDGSVDRDAWGGVSGGHDYREI